MKIPKLIIYAVIAVIIAGLAWYAGFKYNFNKKQVFENKTAIMEKVDKVLKLVAVEGHISEIYSYKDYYYYDISLLRKTALVRVNAKVSVGYDLEGLNLHIDEQNRVIELGNFPEPEILSMDHNLEYYDLDEGTFNNFSDTELTQINTSAKDYSLEKAKESDLFVKADEQKQEILEFLEMLATSGGYTFVNKANQSILAN